MQYVKVSIKIGNRWEKHDEWYLVVSKTAPVTEDFNEKMATRLTRRVVGGMHEVEKGKSMNELERKLYITARGVDYNALAAKSTYDLLVRKSGTYMVLSPNVRVEKTNLA